MCDLYLSLSKTRYNLKKKKPYIGVVVPLILIVSLSLLGFSPCLLWKELRDFQSLIHSLEITDGVWISSLRMKLTCC